MQQPEAILLGGANGSGKTTFARQVLPLLHPGVPFLNSDEIQREALPFNSDVAAAREFLRRLQAVESARRSFAVETTLSSRAYLGRVRRWIAAGYRVTLHFIAVPTADFAVARVAARVALGGHSIPEQDIRRRFHRGLRLFDAVYKPAVPQWYHWFSDSTGLRLVASYREPQP